MDIVDVMMIPWGCASGTCDVQQTAYQYAKKGAVLVLVARREGRLRMVADRSIKRGAMDVRAIMADVSKEQDCRRIIEDTISQYGRCKCGFFYAFWAEWIFLLGFQKNGYNHQQKSLHEAQTIVFVVFDAF